MSDSCSRSKVHKSCSSEETARNNCSGYKQANIVILPTALADNFKQFCLANSGPLPLLYKSQPGESRCPDLADQSDIRTDCPLYCKFQDGIFCGEESNLLKYSGELEDMVTFYLGCSFGFERAVQEVGVPIRNVEQKRNVSMYKTSVPCHAVGSFQCNLVVSMRPIPEGKLNVVAQATLSATDAHGAPVHIGHPGLIGIDDLGVPDFGDAVELHPGDVPVFWACGVTGMEAVKSCRAPLAFTHSPGCMFITDCNAEKPSPGQCPDAADSIQAICISQKPLHFSVASDAAIQKIRSLELLIGNDPGQRGIQALFIPDELLKACLSMSHAKSVLITTGFPTHFDQNPPEETDGPLGALAMAAMLLALQKEVSIVTDLWALDMFREVIADAVEQGVLRSPIPLLSFQENSSESALRFLCYDGNSQTPRYDHLVAIERAGMATDGKYYNMRKVNIQHLVDPIDILFRMASDIPNIATTGIGDGGNELGMGKLKDRVKKHIPNGDLIVCDVEADFAITAGVSNWGGYAISCALYILRCCVVHERYLRKAVGFPTLSHEKSWAAALPTVSKEEKLLEILVKYGIRSGKTGNLGMEVDGLPFHDVHSSIIQQLAEVTLL
ncbi:D-glutamate cyclase, mitochondrial-like isoform X2 [Erpetoichthys calabaricus]|uniref:D-glutamate cyclase, mitochondrial n=1 Tax=Erpetoichthys calabaricus TaxID=27687 RepID=A0A8C4SWX8_ERPCA|nr:D-glutamate cyclase, mitochondrial-like isoform X2 [Erpetoichthys calabaricus]